MKGFIMSVKFIHYRSKKHPEKGGATVAYEDHLDTSGDDGSVKHAMSTCSNSDNFNKRIGRSVAEGRLKKNKSSSIRIRYVGSDYRDQLVFKAVSSIFDEKMAKKGLFR